MTSVASSDSTAGADRQRLTDLRRLSLHQPGEYRYTATTGSRLGLGSDHVVAPFLLPVQL